MTISHTALLSKRILLAVHLFAFVVVLSSLFVYQTVSAADDKGRARIEQRVENMSKKLNLTEQQKKEITAILEEARAQRTKDREAMQQNREEMRKQRKAMRETVETRIAQILTDEQRAELARLKEERKAEMKEGRKKGRGKNKKNRDE